MTIEIVELGRVSEETQGPPAGIFWELATDGIHCNHTQQGGYIPKTDAPVFPGYCLA